MPSSELIKDWDSASISRECRKEYTAYLKKLDEHYASYLKENPEKQTPHSKMVKDLAAALPDGFGDLESELPVGERHRYHLSCKSSQVLALGLLAPAYRSDPSLDWLFESLAPLVPNPGSTENPNIELEATLDKKVLNESPRQTAIDFKVESKDLVLCIEAKWAEEGLGTCSCKKDGRDPAKAECVDRILRDRPLYWEVAETELGLPSRVPGEMCPINTPYQAVRNVAAALALADEHQTPVFGLLYDDRNPYFAGAGDWPGWAAVLNKSINEDAGGRVSFASASWQELARHLPFDEAVSEWARDKHQIEMSSE